MKCTFVYGCTKPLSELALIENYADRWAWLQQNSLTLKFGNGFFSEKTIKAKALKAGIVGVVKCSYQSKAGISAPWHKVKTFEVVL